MDMHILDTSADIYVNNPVVFVGLMQNATTTEKNPVT